MSSKRTARRAAAKQQPTELERVAAALTRVKTIGGLLVARGVGMRQADLGDQFTYLGSKVIEEADAALAALGEAPRASGRKR
jgi:hypothetical protein